MNADPRRSTRYADFLPITVTVGSMHDETLLAGPFSARIVDISNHGVSLLLTQVMLHSFHLFHSTRENEAAALRLQIKLPHSQNSVLIPARPVWLHAEESGDCKVFRMGVNFLTAIDNDLLLKINKMLNTI
ncbi:MAG: PilZ domain-containing protein [Desulfobulbaceae bacterium]